MKPTFLSIGDTVVDAFIELQDAEVTCDIDNIHCKIAMRFGDKIPFTDDVILYGVGNSANASVAVSRLGLASSIITHLGHDENGTKSIQSLQNDNVDTVCAIQQDGIKTNYHYVLRYGPERTILVRHQAFTYDFPSEVAKLTTKPDWVYLSSLASGTETYHDNIATWLSENPDIKLVFQPGSFQMKLGAARLAELYRKTFLFVCNVEEAERILEVSNSQNLDRPKWVAEMMMKLRELGPEIVSVSDGPRGAYATDGISTYFMPPYPDPKPPVERTGAGDSFASTLSAYLAQGMSLADSLARAPINSMSVVQYVGAQAGLLTAGKIEEYLQNAPAEYKIQVI